MCKGLNSKRLAGTVKTSNIPFRVPHWRASLSRYVWQTRWNVYPFVGWGFPLSNVAFPLSVFLPNKYIYIRFTFQRLYSVSAFLFCIVTTNFLRVLSCIVHFVCRLIFSFSSLTQNEFSTILFLLCLNWIM